MDEKQLEDRPMEAMKAMQEIYYILVRNDCYDKTKTVYSKCANEIKRVVRKHYEV